MFTLIDEGNGLVKCYWQDIREKIAKIEPGFTQIVDQLSPDESYPLYIAYYPYGDSDADTQSSLFPNIKGGYYRITDASIPKDIANHLGYSAHSTPLGMVLEKELECFIDLRNEQITIPWLVYKPGDIFPLSTVLNKKGSHVYTPNGLLSSTAGARSTFLLPNIGAAISHSNLQRDFNIKSRAPKSLYDHWKIFKELVNSPLIQSNWRCCVLYFSEKWLVSLHNDACWKSLKQYMHELAWKRYEYERNRIYYDITFSLIQKKRNLKPNPYLVDTAKHLFASALGAVPGYEPSSNNNALPIDIIQKIFVTSYGLKKYWPCVMQANHFDLDNSTFPVYYSLQHPATRIFSPKSRVVSSAINEMRELEHIMGVFIDELSSPETLSSDTVIGDIARNIKFSYFHSAYDSHQIIKSSYNILDIDNRFKNNLFSFAPEAQFPADASFLRGCVSINFAENKTHCKTQKPYEAATVP